MNKPVSIYQPIYSDRVGPAPLVLTVVTVKNNNGLVEGVPANAQKVEQYVLLSALPEELRKRVELAVQAMIAAF